MRRRILTGLFCDTASKSNKTRAHARDDSKAYDEMIELLSPQLLGSKSLQIESFLFNLMLMAYRIKTSTVTSVSLVDLAN